MPAAKKAQLSPRQDAFIREYIIDRNGQQAAVRAGYSEHSARIRACKLLALPHIQEALDKLNAKRITKLDRRAEDVLRDIVDVSDEAREAGNHNAALKGLELQGKHFQMFADRLVIDFSDESMELIFRLLPDDVAAELKRRLARELRKKKA